MQVKKVKKKCILIAIHRFEVGGAETQALYLAKYLKENGFHVYVGAFGDETGLGVDRFIQEGITTLYWGFQEKLLIDPEPGLKGKLIKIKYLYSLIKQVRNISPYILISYTYPPNLIFGKLKRWFNETKVFWNQRDINIGFKGHTWEKSAINNVDTFISNSITGANYIEGLTRKKVHVIPNYIDVKKFKKPYTDIEPEILKVIMIGNIHANKNHIKLLNDWIDVLKMKPKARLYLAGKFGNEYDRCLKFIQENNLIDHVIFLGQVEDIIRLIENCHIAVFYSHGEGMPNGILEPMAAGLPVFVHRHVWSEELLGKEYPFFLSEKPKEGLAYRIESFEKEKFKEIGAKNRNRAKEKFGVKNSLKIYLDLINGK